MYSNKQASGFEVQPPQPHVCALCRHHLNVALIVRFIQSRFSLIRLDDKHIDLARVIYTHLDTWMLCFEYELMV